MVPCKVKVVEVPGKMTHIYQPADQFVISNLRSRIGKSWEGYVEYTVSTQGAIDAAITMQCEAAFVKREREDAITFRKQRAAQVQRKTQPQWNRKKSLSWWKVFPCN